MAEGKQSSRSTSSGGGRGRGAGGGQRRTGGGEEGGEFRSSNDVRTAVIDGRTFGPKPVQYSVVDGMAIFEGDILLGTVEEVERQSRTNRDILAGVVASSVVISGSEFRWPDCRVPYDIDGSLTNQQRVTDAIAHWEANTQYRFILRTAANAASHPDWVTFQPGGGCSAAVGRRGGQQFVTLGTGCSTGSCIHEIGHVVGLWHEQSREDRDAFVTIHWDKIQAGKEHNFNQHINDGDDVGPYDYESIMHYPRNAFSTDGSDTITPVDASAQIGQRDHLSPGDISAANSLCPGGGGVFTIKELPKDPILTKKEITKDVRLDTRKERVLDTFKEIGKDPITIKEVGRDPIFKPHDPIKFDSPLVRERINTGLVQPGFGAVPFAVGAPHHAPGAADAAASLSDEQAGAVAASIDGQLEMLAAQLEQLDVQREMLQQQYDALSAQLQATLDANEARDQ